MERRAITVRGIVQGVGFRPFVYGLATRLGIHGFVKNMSGTLHIEIEGAPPRMDEFLKELTDKAPPLAHIQEITWQSQDPVGDQRFCIHSSEADDLGEVFISPDVATCAACLAELFDPKNRRYLYPFLNCTNCGPRLTIITGAPYDRPRTTMGGFAMCPACRAEYDNPADRRFHAQPTACAICGPRLKLWDGSPEPSMSLDGSGEPSHDLERFLTAIRAGKVGALKGLGGYHLVCDSRNDSAVRTLRQRKHRDEKPFAVMVENLDAARSLCGLDDAESALLQSPRRPIVLLRKVAECPVAAMVAPGNPYLGVMLPYTPVHALLMSGANMPLVMTSGNRSDEPIAYQDDEAVARLKDIADIFLLHDRPIHVRCDDSVTRVVDGLELPIRRSRGYAPHPLTLPAPCRVPILAVGGQLKNTFALGRSSQAFISHHMGDLDEFSALQAFVKDVGLYENLFDIRPRVLAHDLHPDYATTRYADKRAAEEGLSLLKIQHHHAHMASAMAEHGLNEPVIAVVFDGTGYGTDGVIWGGEFLLGDYSSYRRVAHLRYVRMPGGEQAIREPWRMAVTYLDDAQAQCPALAARISHHAMRIVKKLLESGFNAPRTSSAGRLFDAVAALVGIRDRVSYEGQAAIELEWLAEAGAAEAGYPFELPTELAVGGADETVIVDTRPLIQAVATDVNAGIAAARISRRFHASMVDIISAVCGRARQMSGVDAVVLSGGVFMNALLTSEVHKRLQAEAFRVFRQMRVPPNDGGLSLGQLAIAACATQASAT